MVYGEFKTVFQQQIESLTFHTYDAAPKVSDDNYADSCTVCVLSNLYCIVVIVCTCTVHIRVATCHLSSVYM